MEGPKTSRSYNVYLDVVKNSLKLKAPFTNPFQFFVECASGIEINDVGLSIPLYPVTGPITVFSVSFSTALRARNIPSISGLRRAAADCYGIFTIG